MAFGAGTALGSGGNAGTNQATIVATLTAQALAGRLAVIIFALDNIQTTTGDEGAISVVNDSAGGNTWQKAVEFANPSAAPAAQAGATISIWYSTLVNAIPNGGTITATLPNTTRDATAWTAQAFTKGTDSTIVVEKTGTLANNAADPGSLNATTINVECLRIRAIASETNSTNTITVTTNWTTLTGNRSGSGSAAANITVRAEFRISTATSDASDPTYVSADHASAYVAFREDKRMPAALGAFTYTGQAAGLPQGYKVPAAQGAYALSGQDTVLYIPVAAPDVLGVGAAPVASYPVGGSRLVDPAAAGGATMPADFGVYGYTGQVTTVLKQGYALSALAGTYALTGQTVALARPRNVPAVQGAYSYTGQTVLKRMSRAAVFGSYSLTGQAALKRRTYAIQALAGSYSLTGQVANLKQGYAVAAVFGTYALTGQVALKRRGYVVVSQLGTYGYTGVATGGGLLALRGTYTLTGQAASFKRTYAMPAAFGSYSLAGQVVPIYKPVAAPDHLSVADVAVASHPVGGSRLADPSLTLYPPLAANAGSYVLTGQDTAPRGRFIPAAAGFYDYVGAAAVNDRVMPAGAGSYAANGQPAWGTGRPPLQASFGSYSLTGQAVGLKQGYKVTALLGSYLLTGQPATFRRTYVLAAAFGPYSLSGQAAGLPQGYKVTAVFGTYALNGQTVNLKQGYAVGATFGPYVLIGEAAWSTRRIGILTGTYALNGQTAVLRAVRRLTALQGTYALTGQPVGLRRSITLVAASGSYTLTGRPATLMPVRKLVAVNGNYMLGGQLAALRFHRRMTGLPAGSYVSTGHVAAFRRAFPISASFGPYVLTGRPAILRRTYFITATAGDYTYIGFQAGLKKKDENKLNANLGFAAVTGHIVEFRKAWRLVAVRGNYVIADLDHDLRRTRKMPAGTGSYVVNGQVTFSRRRATIERGGAISTGGFESRRRPPAMPPSQPTRRRWA